MKTVEKPKNGDIKSATVGYQKTAFKLYKQINYTIKYYYTASRKKL